MCLYPNVKWLGVNIGSVLYYNTNENKGDKYLMCSNSFFCRYFYTLRSYGIGKYVVISWEKCKIWRPPSPSELTPVIFNMKLT